MRRLPPVYWNGVSRSMTIPFVVLAVRVPVYTRVSEVADQEAELASVIIAILT